MMAHEWLRRADNGLRRGEAEKGLGGPRMIPVGLGMTVEC